MDAGIRAKWNYTSQEASNRNELFQLFKKCPIPENEFLMNMPLFFIRQDLSHTIFMNELYKKIINTHGIVMEFGVRWGRNLCLFESFRGMYEPFNHNRKIIGFDTFEGATSIDKKDKKKMAEGDYSVPEDYEKYLAQILDCHEKESPISHIKKYQMIKGKAEIEITNNLRTNPDTIVALAFFDFGIYIPTKKCLEAIKGHLTKGSIVAFDHLNSHDETGETIAFREVFGIDTYMIERNPLSPLQSYVVIK